MSPSEDFAQIKRELIFKINKIDTFITGDPMSNPPIKGVHERLADLEAVERSRIKNKNELIKISVGSITIAIGGAVIWMANVIREAFIKAH